MLVHHRVYKIHHYEHLYNIIQNQLDSILMIKCSMHIYKTLPLSISIGQIKYIHNYKPLNQHNRLIILLYLQVSNLIQKQGQILRNHIDSFIDNYYQYYSLYKIIEPAYCVNKVKQRTIRIDYFNILIISILFSIYIKNILYQWIILKNKII